jgi:AraC-like DNA-binding protein
LLALLFVHPDQEYSLSEIARRVGMSLPTVHAETGRLMSAGLLSERRLGQARLVRAHGEHILTRPLTELLELTNGPAAVLPDVLGGLPGLRRAFVFGSWAARRLGEPGAATRDVDVVVVGTTPRARLVEAEAEAEAEATRRLHREVNITRIPPPGGRRPRTRSSRRSRLVRWSPSPWATSETTSSRRPSDHSLGAMPSRHRRLTVPRTADACSAQPRPRRDEGLHAGGEGAHAVLLEAVLAQLDPPLGSTLRPFSWMCPLRNHTQHPAPERPTAQPDDVEEALPAARSVVDTAAEVLDTMPAY